MLDGYSPNAAANYVVAIIIGIIVICGTAVIFLVKAERGPATSPGQHADPKSDYSVGNVQRLRNQFLEAVAPPTPYRRTSIDILRRRYQGCGGESMTTCQAASSDIVISAKSSRAAISPPSHSPLDTMELDTGTVAILDCAGVNRILSCVPLEELENHRLVRVHTCATRDLRRMWDS
ncbi:hypothetical protein VOLCADRAFT_94011 [Volvox carteri f. nagariensis]|uniref:Uncharacterized protein n=1 Tax=Volvox carteri f. nagariensis TaxID=3068 RepID=D8U3N8_VOLCA|nr:uncharacterized protein VOLCADRAFT_94011 [Volvox carteri f. nagariensis]EFJ45641.1 hypothetical protein VOLCADRAFT_94011 [Volvox carteri f. nagariensis]|eukprot:XP_002953331.1 hypothetical protein VOLCADRAFT_94011 [Volvox carteri f. nagariensis]